MLRIVATCSLVVGVCEPNLEVDGLRCDVGILSRLMLSSVQACNAKMKLNLLNLFAALSLAAVVAEARLHLNVATSRRWPSSM